MFLPIIKIKTVFFLNVYILLFSLLSHNFVLEDIIIIIIIQII
jgi:hypothetical protein